MRDKIAAPLPSAAATSAMLRSGMEKLAQGVVHRRGKVTERIKTVTSMSNKNSFIFHCLYLLIRSRRFYHIRCKISNGLSYPLRSDKNTDKSFLYEWST